MAFDPSLKKKKKKKKTFDLDAALAEEGAEKAADDGDTGAAADSGPTENGAVKEAVNVDGEFIVKLVNPIHSSLGFYQTDLDLDKFDLESFGTKKKKKKRPTGMTATVTEGEEAVDKENEGDTLFAAYLYYPHVQLNFTLIPLLLIVNFS